MAVAVQDMLRTPGLDNDAGIKTILYYARYHDIQTWPTSVDDPENQTDLESRVTLTGNFVMKTGKLFGKMEVTLEKGMLDSNGAGAQANSSAENILKVFRYGHQKSLVGWIETFKNDDLVMIAEDLSGNYRVLGSPGLPAVILPDWKVTGGDAVSSEKFIEFNVKSVGRIAKFYTGTIPLTGGV
jgi:hypothetical protein